MSYFKILIMSLAALTAKLAMCVSYSNIDTATLRGVTVDNIFQRNTDICCRVYGSYAGGVDGVTGTVSVSIFSTPNHQTWTTFLDINFSNYQLHLGLF